MKVVTFTYTPDAPSVKKMIESFKRFHEIEVLQVSDFVPDHPLAVYNYFLNCEDELFCYADSWDTFCQRPLNVPKDYLLWSTEKACFPHHDLAPLFPETNSRWKYLNNGIYCGPTKLIQEYYKRYQLYDVHHRNGQDANMRAFLQAHKEGFPIKLDQGCEELQSIAFLDYDDFVIENGMVKNNILGTIPAVIHANGSHVHVMKDMEWIYRLWPEGRIR